MKNNSIYRVSLFAGFLFISTLTALSVPNSGVELPYEEEKSVPESDIDAEEGLSLPLFSMLESDEEYDPADDEINTAAALSAEQTQAFLDAAKTKPNGYVWIRAYIGKKYDSTYPDHNYEGVSIEKEFMTVTWFRFGKRVEWDAFPISSGKYHSNEGRGAWTSEGNFSIIGRMGKYHRSSIYKSPMPYALDHDGVKKIHVGDVTGKPASHGCIRVPSNGKWTAEGGKNKGYLLDKIVSKIGMSNVLVSVYRQKPELTNELPASTILARMNAPQDISALKFHGF